jgi:hypothetical protein
MESTIGEYKVQLIRKSLIKSVSYEKRVFIRKASFFCAYKYQQVILKNIF